ncbi:MAG: porin [Planctomycetota bacterium]
MTPRPLLLLPVLVGVLATWTPSQSPAPAKTFEERLVEILEERGLVDEATRKELLDLATRMKAEEAAAREGLDREIRALEAVAGRGSQGEAPEVRATYRKGFILETADEDFSLKIGGKLQIRGSYLDRDDDGTGSNSTSFSVNRARAEFEGNAFGKDLTFKLTTDLRGGSASLRDGYLNYAFEKAVQIRGGQFKVPFSRQELTSAFRQQFVDRSFVTDTFAPGREPGAMLHGSMEDGVFEYALGAFNGDGQNVNTNDDNAVRWAGRVGVNPLGAVPYSEGDLDRTQEILLGIGVNAMHNPTRGTPDADVDSFGLDGILLTGGLSVQGELFLQRSDVENGPTAEDEAAYVQAGYLIADGWEIAGRVAGASFDNDVLATGDTRQQREFQVGLSRYFRKHDLKIQADATHRSIDVLGNQDELDRVLRLQAQLVF